MQDETEQGQEAELAVLTVVPVAGLGAWTVRITVPHPDGVASGWAPYVFWSPEAAASWSSARARTGIRPTVRDCGLGPNELAYPAVVDDEGEELCVGEPTTRVRAAGIAALLAAELRLAALG